MGLILALGMNFFGYWFSDKVVLKMYGARQVDEALEVGGADAAHAGFGIVTLASLFIGQEWCSFVYCIQDNQ